MSLHTHVILFWTRVSGHSLRLWSVLPQIKHPLRAPPQEWSRSTQWLQVSQWNQAEKKHLYFNIKSLRIRTSLKIQNIHICHYIKWFVINPCEHYVTQCNMELMGWMASYCSMISKYIKLVSTYKYHKGLHISLQTRNSSWTTTRLSFPKNYLRIMCWNQHTSSWNYNCVEYQYGLFRVQRIITTLSWHLREGNKCGLGSVTHIPRAHEE